MIEEENTIESKIELGIDWTEKLDIKKIEEHINAYFKASKQTCLPDTEKESLHNKLVDFFMSAIYDYDLSCQLREKGVMKKVLDWLGTDYRDLPLAIQNKTRETYIDWSRCTDFTSGSKIINNWLLCSNYECLPMEDNVFLFDKIIDWYPMLTKEQQDDWDNPDLDSSLWTSLFSWVGNLQAEEWLYLIKSQNLFK